MPSFEVSDQDGRTVRSEDFIGKGRKTVIYFYPKDNTSGCTAEACSFRDSYGQLREAGYDYADVVKTTVLLADIKDFGAMNAIYAEYFNEPFPARVCYQVAALPMGARVEIDAVAVK